MGLTIPTGKGLLLLLAGILALFALICDRTIATIPSAAGSSFLIPLTICACFSAALGYLVVPMLQRLKAAQVVREDGPQSHLKKAGTPTMGGIFFVPIAAIVAPLLTNFAAEVVAVSLVTLAHGFVGWIDDWQILKLKSNKGISPRAKLALQIAIAALFCLWMGLTQSDKIVSIDLPFGVALSLGILFWPLAIFVFAAESNATNFTDGVDGLAAGTGAIALLGLAAIVAPQNPSLSIFCSCLSGSCLGFVVHNRNPAKVFMGDTGSLALGGALAAVGLLGQSLWGLFIVSGLFFIESLSVIAQVTYYKATKGPDGKGKRLLKMAPFHHHLELSGWAETQIVAAFYFVCLALSLCGIAFK
jgi:phospho-N-acetylmuramoyl-pentapeptide-transferase